MSPSAVEYAKKVGVICGATMAALALLGVVWSAAVTLTISPRIQAIVSEERIARAAADQELTQRISEIADTQVQLSQDRVMVLRVLEARSAAERRFQIQQARERWGAQPPPAQPRIYGR